MGSKGVKLFKIATQINVGKDTIVEYLQSKGYDIENKATAVLDDEMLDVVLDNFQKEHSAALKQRQKVEELKKHKQAAKDEAQAAAGAAPVAQEESAEAAPPAPAVEQPEVQEPPQAPPVEEVAAPETPDSEFPVGTVIALDNLSSGRKRREEREEPVQEPAPVEEVAPEAPPPAPAPVVQAEETKVQEIPEPVQPPVAEQPQPEPPAVEPPAPVTAEAPAEPVAETPAEPEPQAAAPEAAETPEAAQDDDEHEHDADGKRRRKKKKFGEIQYQTTGSPQLKGLTILGKIELVPRSRKNDKKQDPKADGLRLIAVALLQFLDTLAE